MADQISSDSFGPILPRHIIMLLALATVWGTSFLVIKIGVEYMSAIQLTAFRLSVAAFVMIICALIMRSDFPTGVRAWTYCFVLALFGNSLPFFLISWGEEEIASGLAAILMAVMPLTTLILAHFFTSGDRLRPQKLVGIIFGFIGVIVLVGPEALKGLGGDFIHQLATAGGATCYAISVIIVRRMPPTPMMGRAALVLAFSVIQTVPLAMYISDWSLPVLSVESLWPSIYLGVFPTAIATLILFKLLSEREPSFVAFQNYLVPVFGVMWGALLLDEIVTAQAMVALALILCGIYVANRRGKAELGGARVR